MPVIRTFLASLASRFRFEADADPARDWRVLLGFFALAFAVVIVWNVWAFQTIVGGGVLGEAGVAAPPSFDQAAINALPSALQSRAAESAKYTDGRYRFADPSK